MESEELYTWEGDERVSDWYPQFFNMMGKLEFQYTIKPLSDMLEEKAKEKYGKNTDRVKIFFQMMNHEQS